MKDSAQEVKDIDQNENEMDLQKSMETLKSMLFQKPIERLKSSGGIKKASGLCRFSGQNKPTECLFVVQSSVKPTECLSVVQSSTIQSPHAYISSPAPPVEKSREQKSPAKRAKTKKSVPPVCFINQFCISNMTKTRKVQSYIKMRFL